MPRTIENWNQEYAQGAHWERGHSPQVEIFAESLKPGDKVLDAGCGSGRDTLFLSKQGLDVIGVDISDVGVKKASAQARQQGLSARFAVENLELLSLADKSFDAVYSVYTLQETDLNKSIAELARVSKPGAPARFALLEKTQYEQPNPFDEDLDHGQIMAIIEKYFNVISQSTDEYDETDQHGKHRHRRLIVQLQRK